MTDTVSIRKPFQDEQRVIKLDVNSAESACISDVPNIPFVFFSVRIICGIVYTYYSVEH